jgi:hypothetical protein
MFNDTHGHRGLWSLVASGLGVAVVLMPMPSAADEGGVSFWLPGQYASLAATPLTPGWSLSGIYYHSSIEASGGQTFNRGGGIQAGLRGDADLGLLAATYVFADPVLGGQAAITLAEGFGRINAFVQATLTGPGGGTISGEAEDTRTGFTDFYPTASLRWNEGVNSFMVYLAGDIPIGAYDDDRLANVGIGHGAIDVGGAYTYFNPQTGHEFSLTAGLTYNFENEATDYQNGIDSHIDWGASQFVSETTHIGLAGYLYQQLTGDSGDGATLGDFKSRIVGIGPQIGHLFPAGNMQGYFNLRGYYEFAEENRPPGWNVMVTLAFSPPAPHHAE